MWAGLDERGCEVAIKIFSDPQLLGRAFDEAGALARITHPNIVTIHAVHRGSDSVAVVMDLAAATVSSFVQDFGALRGAQVVRLVTDMCAGIATLHASGLAHGDISPNNVALTMDGAAQLLDFGAVRDEATLGTDGFSQRVSRHGEDLGRGEILGRGDLADSEDPRAVEYRMRRLLGAAGERASTVPGGLERMRDDVLGAALVGLYALGDTSGRGSVAQTVEDVLKRHIDRVKNGVTGSEVGPQALAAAVGEVIPPAPITVPMGAASAQSVDGAKAVNQTRRVGQTDLVDIDDDALWGSPAKETDETAVATKPDSRRGIKRPVLTTAAIALGIAAFGGGIAIGLGENTLGGEAAHAAGVDETVSGVGGKAVTDDALRNESAEESQPALDSGDAQYWQQIINDLGAARDAVLVSGGVDDLVTVNAVDSPAMSADQRTFEDLGARGLVVREIETVTEVVEVLSVGAGQVELLVETGIVFQQLERDGNSAADGGAQGFQSAARAEADTEMEAVVMVLISVDDEWLISEIRQA